MKFYLKIVFGFLGAAIIWLGGITAAPADPPWPYDQAVVSSLNGNPDFADEHAQLQALVNLMGFHTINHFCIITYGNPGDTDFIPFIYWPTQDKFIEWGTGPSPTIMGAGHYFDLSRDLVHNGRNTSPDFLTHSDVYRLIVDCRARGKKYTITKTANGWVSIDRIFKPEIIKSQLQNFVDQFSRPSLSTNKFCVIGQRDGPFRGLYAYWITANQLLFWLPAPTENYFDIFRNSFVQIDLKHGLRDKEDPATADNRNEMQRSYADAIIGACHKSGKYLTIKRSG